MRTRKRISLLLIWALSLCLLSCKGKSSSENAAFTGFTNRLFTAQISSDSLSLNYTLANPKNFGIDLPAPVLGTCSYENKKTVLIQAENLLQSLESFERKDMSFYQQILYDTLYTSYQHTLLEQKFPYYEEILSPSGGIQAQLPILLCEYHFREKEDIDRYLALLSSMPSYYESILNYEKEKAENGTFMDASTASDIILQCKELIKAPKKNVLIKNFNERLKSISFLSNAEKKIYRQKNRQYVLDYVIKAYQDLILGLENLLPEARSEGGLASLEAGPAYYEYLAQESVGTNRTIKEMRSMLEKALEESRGILLQLAADNPTLFSQSNRAKVGQNTPAQILNTLKASIQEHFPAVKETICEVKYVDDSLEDFLNPAFYLVPPIDDSSQNVIYVNAADRFQNTDLFPTLAHEGYPGHLYQNIYQNEHSFSPMQALLNFGGYTEGWATYAELYAYHYAKLDDDQVQLLRNNTISSLCLYSLCDIGIHSDGWTLENTQSFLSQYGIRDAKTCETIYLDLLSEPASYLKYSMGYLEIIQLKNQARRLLGKDYTDLKFHTFFLDMGPTWFPVLKNNMESWFTK